ncbi:hypothetical protein GCM10010182_08680 [Actinomadura cremea]|nr:hypothetical protein GCM10010182_08680 [Actinomadura cremea]
MLDACTRLRDRFSMSLMFETGCRVGRAPGLRHEDISTDQRFIRLLPREDNADRARGRSREARQIPVRQALCDLYVDCLFGEYGELESDCVFVNLWGGQEGEALTYRGAMSLVERLRRHTGVDFHPHLFRSGRPAPVARGTAFRSSGGTSGQRR